ncbi:hypothetical protein [Methylobacterium indicum]|nr:hypothetical protein [Methylobacterium indicum]
MKRSVNVLDYGARMDGSWDVPAYNAARAATGYNGVVEVPPGQFWADVQADPNKCVLWKLSGNTYAGGNAPVSVIGSDIVETFLPYEGGRFLSQGQTNRGSQALQTFQRSVTHTDANNPADPGVLSTVRVSTNVTADVKPYVFGLTSVIDDRTGVARPNGNICAAYLQYNRYQGGQPGWSAALETADYTNTMSSQSAALLGEEVLIKVNRADDAGIRFVQDLVVGRALKDDPKAGKYYETAEVTAFSRCSNVHGLASEGHAKFGYLVAAGITDAAFNAAPAMWMGAHAVALRTGAGANVDFSAENSHMLRWQPGAGLEYRVGQNPVLTVRDSGVINRPDANPSEVPTSRSDPRGSYGDEVKYGDRVYFKTSGGWYSVVMSPLP